MSRRAEFTAKIKEKAYQRSLGFCEWYLIGLVGEGPLYNSHCGSMLKEGNVFYEHINVDHNSKDNSLENCACLCKIHWRIKTDRYDKPLIAKTKRQRRRAIGIRKTKYPMRGWRKFDGTPVKAGRSR